MSTISLLTLSVYVYIFNSFYLFIFGYAGSSLLREGFSLVEVCGLLTVVASFVEHSSRACGLSSCGSVLLHELCCPVACGIFPDQGSNPYPLHWQGDSLPLSHQGCPLNIYFLIYFFLHGTSLSPHPLCLSLSSIPTWYKVDVFCLWALLSPLKDYQS